MKPLALYIHVPFCARKCAYCDFASWPGREGEWRRYFDALVTEIRLWSENTDFGLLKERFRVRSAFVGGGTPTLVRAEWIAEALELCRKIAPFDADAEITVEGNPGTLTPEKLRTYRQAGVNRLSMGAQSFDDGLLHDLGRIHTAGQIVEAVEMARDAGFSNINLDLMYGLPGQTMGQWLDTLKQAVALGVPHISAYSLILEPGTPLYERVARGEVTVPDDEAVIAMQRAAAELLSKSDFGRYEISNYARPKSESCHNLTYWYRGDYLGLGCAAHSMLDETRFSNPDSLDEYLARRRMTDVQRLNRWDIIEETVMLNTRATKGIDLAAWERRFGRPFAPEDDKALERLTGAGYIEIADGRLYLTGRGLEVQNAVVLELLEIQEAMER
ncbi:MAG: radical SAM family heme chaperone HemW [Clostridia bacterium]|nr:radical SAM family heme chaperone HemW [Clostridia bacterium]